VSQWILGIRPEYDGLMIDPCIPSSWDGFEVKRTFRGCDYNITVNNPNHVSKGVKRFLIDGKEIKGNIVPPIKGKKTVKVEAELG